jgi:SAM-dependent methyltransferase
MSSSEVRTAVREKYGEIARGRRTGCGCGTGGTEAIATEIGYTPEQLAAIPEGANLGLGCGNPIRHAGLRSGEVVVDLGAGAGMDAFLAAREVGPTGRVIGVDMTPAMVERARANAEKAGATNVEFRLGEIEHLPVADATADVVISNCVINLSTDKRQVFREALRALKSGGRLVVSDLVLRRELPEAVRDSIEAYVGCVAGALRLQDYLAQAREAGFAGIEIVEQRGYGDSDVFGGEPWLREAAGAVVSVKVRARKP